VPVSLVRRNNDQGVLVVAVYASEALLSRKKGEEKLGGVEEGETARILERKLSTGVRREKKKMRGLGKDFGAT